MLRSLHRLQPRRSTAIGRLAGFKALLLALGGSACGHLGIDLGDGVALDGAGNEGAASSGSAPLETGGLGGAAAGSGAASSGGGAAGGGGRVSGGSAPGSGGTGGTGLGGSGASGGDSPGSGGAGLGAAGAGGITPGGGGGVQGGGGSSGGGGGGGNSGGGGAASFDCSSSDAVCQQLATAMVTRFSFDGVGTQLSDSRGVAVGTLYGTALNGSGQISFSGSNAYAELSPMVVSALPNATFEVWFVWRGGAPWQKLFEFGSHDALNSPVSYLYVTPLADGSNPAINALAAALRHPTGGDKQLRTGELTQTGVLTQVVLVANDDLDRLSLYKNGQWLGDRDTPVTLSALQDQTNRLGRSLFPDDPYFNGDIMDFRIYGDVLTSEMIQKSYALGPDATYPP